MRNPLPCFRRTEPSAALIPNPGQQTLAYVPAARTDIRERIQEFNLRKIVALEARLGCRFLSSLARHLDVRIQAKGTATLSSSVQQVLGHRRRPVARRDRRRESRSNTRGGPCRRLVDCRHQRQAAPQQGFGNRVVLADAEHHLVFGQGDLVVGLPIGLLQTLALADDLDVPSNLYLGREIIKFNLGPFSILDRKTMKARTLEALQKTAVKIPNVDNPIRNMSGGQRQCVAIARTAAFKSKLVIMDEPTAALGVQETAQVENIIRTLKAQGEPLILISHNLRQVFDLVDRIVVFRRGRIVASLNKDETDGNDIVSYITGVKGGTDASYA